MSDVVVRPIRDEDWPAVFRIIDEVVRDGETYAYPEDVTADSARELWVERPPGLTVVAERDGRILGSAKMGPNRPGRGDHVGTASFMVAADARGLGIGRLLGEWVVDRHRRAGFAGIQFNAVVESNEVAVGLWRSLGFEVVGTVPGAFRSRRHGRVGLHVMYLAL